jgi:cellulose synthase/poly-beta-1,6-N-acetylglucosamine synthase-like glycosyltransferase
MSTSEGDASPIAPPDARSVAPNDIPPLLFGNYVSIVDRDAPVFKVIESFLNEKETSKGETITMIVKLEDGNYEVITAVDGGNDRGLHLLIRINDAGSPVLLNRLYWDS